MKRSDARSKDHTGRVLPQYEALGHAALFPGRVEAPVAGPRVGRRHQAQGTALVWVTGMLVVWVGFVGLTIDIGMAFLAAHQLHNAADAGALAGAQWVKLDKDRAVTETANTAKANFALRNDVDLEYSYANGVFSNDEDIVLGRYYPQRRRFNMTPYFEPNVAQANAVLARARRATDALDKEVKMPFGRVVDVNILPMDVVRHAIAYCLDTSGAGIIALKPTGTGLTMGGNFTIQVPKGDIQVNSDSHNAVVFNGTPKEGDIVAVQMNVCGYVDSTLVRNCPIPYDDEYPPNDPPPIPDPLAGVHRPGTPGGDPGPGVYSSPIFADPTKPKDPISENNWPTDPITGKKELWPGYYPAGFKISGGMWHLNPGVYLLGGGVNGNSGLVLTGGIIEAEYCQFYITKDTVNKKGKYGQVNITGNAQVTITPPGNNPDNYVNGEPVKDGAMGVSIWQDDANKNVAFIAGSSNDPQPDVVQGTLYFPCNTAKVAGDNFYAGNQLIAYTIEPGGNGDIYIDYDNRNRGPIRHQSMLVE